MITPLLGAYFVISLQLSLFFHTLAQCWAVVFIGLVLLETADRTQWGQILFEDLGPHFLHWKVNIGFESHDMF